MTLHATIRSKDGSTKTVEVKNHTTVFTCDRCKKEIVHTDKLTTGYGRDPETDAKICYQCCGEVDQERMIETGEIVLYLTMKDKAKEIETRPGIMKTGSWMIPDKLTNWPGSLTFEILSWSKGDHNWNIDRYDLWFKGPDNRVWYGRFQGSWTQLTYCRRTKHTGISGYIADRHGLTV